MSEIEKLYENAGVKKTPLIENCIRCWYGTCVLSEKECKKKNKQKCKNFKGNIIEGNYPSFTAEKQLELLKICFDKYERLEKVRGLKERCIIYHHFESNGYTEFINCETWEETIAGLINNVWQSLTDVEQEQIRDILKG